MTEKINWLSLLIATLIPIIIGFIYYQKRLFGNIWYTTITMPKNDSVQLHPLVRFVISFLVCFSLSIFLLILCNGQEGQLDTFSHGAKQGFILSILVIIPISITGVLYNERSWANMLINAGYWLISLPLMGGFLDMMNHF